MYIYSGNEYTYISITYLLLIKKINKKKKKYNILIKKNDKMVCILK